MGALPFTHLKDSVFKIVEKCEALQADGLSEEAAKFAQMIYDAASMLGRFLDDVPSDLPAHFLVTWSHELRTPLAPIHGYAELVLTVYQNALNAEQHSTFTEIRDGARALSQWYDEMVQEQNKI
jgi:signal transduction histidine kinase